MTILNRPSLALDTVFPQHSPFRQSVAKNIGSAVRRAGVARLYGAQGAVNVQGEEQQKLDVIANQIFITLLR